MADSPFVSALETLRAILADVPAGVGEPELDAAEARLGVTLPDELRAYYQAFGNEPRVRGVVELARLRVVDGALILFASPGEGWQLALKTTGKREAPVVRSGLGGAGDLGAGSLIDRPRSDRPWKSKHRELQPYLLESAMWRVIEGAPHRFVGRIPARTPEARQRLRENLEPIGVAIGAKDLFVDRKLRAFVRYDYLLTRPLHVGALRGEAREELDARLGTALVALPRAGKAVKAPTPRTKARTGDEFDVALVAIAKARYGAAFVEGKASRRKVGLPAPLTEFHRVFAHDPGFFDRERHVVPLAKLARAGSHCTIVWENQHLVGWSLRRGDLAKADPPVWERARGATKATKAAASLRAFLVQTAAWQALFGMEEVGRALVAPPELEATTARLRVRFGLPGGEVFATATQEAFASSERRVLASLVREGDGATLYVGATRRAMQTLGEDIGVEVESL